MSSIMLTNLQTRLMEIDGINVTTISMKDLDERIKKLEQGINVPIHWELECFNKNVGNDSGSSSEPTQVRDFTYLIPAKIINATIQTYINRVQSEHTYKWTNYPKEGMTLDGVYTGWGCSPGVNTRTDKVSELETIHLHGKPGYSYLWSNGNWYAHQWPLTIRLTIDGMLQSVTKLYYNLVQLLREVI